MTLIRKITDKKQTKIIITDKKHYILTKKNNQDHPWTKLLGLFWNVLFLECLFCKQKYEHNMNKCLNKRET